jgi:hypothetical protein
MSSRKKPGRDRNAVARAKVLHAAEMRRHITELLANYPAEKRAELRPLLEADLPSIKGRRLDR